ncbi:hypothetical protein EP7_002281 [Isosphaeraceae bacterium EP7]
MIIILPSDLENSIEAAVHRGRFASVDEAMIHAAKLLLREIDQQPTTDPTESVQPASLGFIGALRDDADLLDQAVKYVMQVRRKLGTFYS